MNRLLKLFLVTLLMVFAALPMSAKSDARANVFMNDGSIYENVEIDFTKSWCDDFKIVVDNDNVKLQSDNVDHIVMWPKDNPENKVYLKRWGLGKYNSKDKKYEPDYYGKSWLSLEVAGNHLSYWMDYMKIKVTKDKIKFTLNDTGKSAYFLKAGDTSAYCVTFDLLFPKRTRDWLKAFLADDTELCDRISEKGYFSRREAYRAGGNFNNPFLFEQIAVDYNPQKQ